MCSEYNRGKIVKGRSFQSGKGRTDWKVRTKNRGIKGNTRYGKGYNHCIKSNAETRVIFVDYSEMRKGNK